MARLALFGIRGSVVYPVRIALVLLKLFLIQVEVFLGRGIGVENMAGVYTCLLYTSPSPRDGLLSRMPSSA